MRMGSSGKREALFSAEIFCLPSPIPGIRQGSGRDVQRNAPLAIIEGGLDCSLVGAFKYLPINHC